MWFVIKWGSSQIVWIEDSFIECSFSGRIVWILEGDIPIRTFGKRTPGKFPGVGGKKMDLKFKLLTRSYEELWELNPQYWAWKFKCPVNQATFVNCKISIVCEHTSYNPKPSWNRSTNKETLSGLNPPRPKLFVYPLATTITILTRITLLWGLANNHFFTLLPLPM